MFKQILYIIIILLSFSILSCDRDDYTDDSVLVPRNSNGTLSIDLPAEMVENDTVFEFTVTVDPPQVVDIHIPVSAVSDGTAVEDEDFTVSHLLVIPAFESTATGQLTILSDCEIEENEKVTIQIGNAENANLNLSQSTHTIDLTNSIGDGLDVYATWEGTVNVGGVDYALCENVDIDLYLLDADGNNLFGYDGATGNCTEHIVMSGLADGTYDLMANLWLHTVPYDSVTMEIATYPISVEFDKCGSYKTPGAQSLDNAVRNSDADYYMGGSVFRPVAKITVNGDDYTWEMQ